MTGAVHHHLIREKSRTRAGLVVEAGDVRECHHLALLVGYGAAAVNPYLAIETVRDLVRRGDLEGVSEKKAEANLLKALGKGLLKIMSKMGVSTVASYTGAQIFEAVGLGAEVIETCFAGTTSRLSGVGFDALAAEIAQRTAPGSAPDYRRLPDRRRVRLAPGGRAAPVQPGGGLQAPARDAQPPVRDLQGVHLADRRPVQAADDAARAAAHPGRGPGDRSRGRGGATKPRSA